LTGQCRLKRHNADLPPRFVPHGEINHRVGRQADDISLIDTNPVLVRAVVV
jgi:hypothetical protein